MGKVRKQGPPGARAGGRQARDRRRQIVYLAAEGEGTERDYFRKLQELLDDQGRYVLHVAPNPNGLGTARQVVDAVIALRGEDQAPAWAICDRDDKVMQNSADIPAAVKRAGENGVSFVLCNPCFEVWLYLHFKDRTAAFGNQKRAIEDLRKAHAAFADYDTREGDRKRLGVQRLSALFGADNLQRASARARSLHERCEQKECDHPARLGQCCKTEHRDPSSPLHELLALFGLDGGEAEKRQS